MGGEGRSGTTGTGPHRRIGNGMCVCVRTRCSRRWPSLTGTEVPARSLCRIRPRGPPGANGRRGTAWNHRYRPALAHQHRDVVVRPHSMFCSVSPADRYRGSSPVSVSHPPHGTLRCAWEARDDLEPPVPAPTSASAPGCDCAPTLDARAGGPRSPVPRFQPVFCVASAPGDPQVRMGDEGRTGTTGTGPHRCIGTGM